MVWPVIQAPARGQEDRGAGDVVGLAEAPQRGAALEALGSPGCPRARGRNRSSPGPGAMQLTRTLYGPDSREVARQLHVGRLGDRVGADHARAAQPADRRDDDDRAVLPLLHLRRDHVDQPVVGDDVVVEDLAECSSEMPPIGP